MSNSFPSGSLQVSLQSLSYQDLEQTSNIRHRLVSVWVDGYAPLVPGLLRGKDKLILLGIALHGNSTYYQTERSNFCYDIPQVPEIVYEKDGGEVTFTNSLMGVTPFCGLSTDDDQESWFNVLNSFSHPNDFETGFGIFLSWVSIFPVGVYFITSFDSGSLIVDHLASNGYEDTHWIQRVFWVFTEGARTTVCKSNVVRWSQKVELLRRCLVRKFQHHCH